MSIIALQVPSTRWFNAPSHLFFVFLTLVSALGLPCWQSNGVLGKRCGRERREPGILRGRAGRI